MWSSVFERDSKKIIKLTSPVWPHYKTHNVTYEHIYSLVQLLG